MMIRKAEIWNFSQASVTECGRIRGDIDCDLLDILFYQMYKNTNTVWIDIVINFH